MSQTLETIMHLIIGGVIGFLFAKWTERQSNQLRDIKEELDEVVEHTHTPHTEPAPVTHEDKSGFKWNFNNVAMLIIVLLVAFAAFASQKATNDSKDTQNQVIALSLCNQEFLSKTIMAINQRTEFSSSQASANLNLQKSQATFLALLLGKPPATEQARIKATQDYFDDLTQFISVSEKSQNAITNNPYPTNQELSACLRREMDNRGG